MFVDLQTNRDAYFVSGGHFSDSISVVQLFLQSERKQREKCYDTLATAAFLKNALSSFLLSVLELKFTHEVKPALPKITLIKAVW